MILGSLVFFFGIVDASTAGWLSIERPNGAFCHARSSWVLGDSAEGSTVIVLYCE